ncbi:MAG: complex I subunit 5 family protein [Lachnospiraceae bacterium]
MILVSILTPVLAGLLLLLMPEWKNRKSLCGYTAFFLGLTAVLVGITLAVVQNNTPLQVFNLTKTLPILFKVDGTGRFFVVLTSIVWLLAGLYSFSYMSHEENEKRYYGFYLIVYGILIGLDFSGNLITFYMFYELMTLLSMPLVLHNRTREAILAGMKYLFFSFAGAYMVLFGLYFLNRYANTLTFTAGGVLDTALIGGNEGFLLLVAFLMLLGFGVKAGMFPMHVWLPAAHPVAPAPASGALSGIIVKAGVLGVIRTVYYLFGTDFIRGTWVQEVWLILILITVLMGSMMAYREKILKKRLAYSTVSQVAYILFGLAMLQPDSLTGAFLHAGAHAFMKCGLFLIAGAIIFKTGKTRVEELTGIGKKMPLTMVCFTLLSLSMIGIPPFAGFVSKWYLGIGSIAADMPVFSILGPAILLVSALLTAAYLLPISIKAFLPGADFTENSVGEDAGTSAIKASRTDAPLLMQIAIVVLTLLVAIMGMFPTYILTYVGRITAAVFKTL